MAREQIQRVFLPIPGRLYHLQRPVRSVGGTVPGTAAERVRRRPAQRRGVKGRVEVVPVPTAYTVLIDYAHSPNALENILLTARDFTAGRLICLFGCSLATGTAPSGLLWAAW